MTSKFGRSSRFLERHLRVFSGVLVSGPEDASESLIEWKRRLAAEARMGEMSDEALHCLKFFEVTTPNWRSAEASVIIRELCDRFWETLEPKQQQSYAVRVHTGRTSNRVPLQTPYDFMINREWYEKFKDTHPYSIILRDWYKQNGDPEGFGANCPQMRMPSDGDGDGDTVEAAQ
ncbi:hypothetical protein K474DRAFT_1727685 [Panus rudis PR-1116 ss-1]|nr:hypothetical protein K474DRAFT_1727685 [Panus rudis PR-1116 ss-1]